MAGPLYGSVGVGSFLNSSTDFSAALPEITGNGFSDSLIVVLQGKCSISRIVLRGAMAAAAEQFEWSQMRPYA